MKHPQRRHVLFALAAAASGRAFASDRTVRGSGRIVSERRVASGFEKLSISGSFQVEIHQGALEGVELSGADNLLALVETTVDGPMLRIRPKEDVQLEPTGPLRVRVELIRVSAINLGGSGHVAAPGLHAARLGVSVGGPGGVDLAALEAEQLAINIGGSGRVSADGRAGELSIKVGGSGDCALPRLVVEEARIGIAGSGHAEVNVNRKLTVSIAGSGHVRHTGTAVPQVSVVGSGSVQRS